MKTIFSSTLFINEFFRNTNLKMQLKIQAAIEFQTVQVCTFNKQKKKKKKKKTGLMFY